MNLLFDLDGTLIDSKIGIFKAYKLSIKNHIKPVTEIKFKNYIGPPFSKLLKNIHPNIDNNTAKKIIINFRRLYDHSYYKEFEIYNGVDELLGRVSNNFRCFIVTNKPTKPSIEIIKKLKLYNSFEGIIGIDYFSTFGQSKKDNISNLILEKKLSKKASFYIGDTNADFNAALQNNINFIAYTKGYYSWQKDELLKTFYHYDHPSKLMIKLTNMIK